MVDGRIAIIRLASVRFPRGIRSLSLDLEEITARLNLSFLIPALELAMFMASVKPPDESINPLSIACAPVQTLPSASGIISGTVLFSFMLTFLDRKSVV